MSLDWDLNYVHISFFQENPIKTMEARCLKKMHI